MFSNMTRFHYGYRREVRYQGNGRFTKFQLLLMKTQAVFARREIALEGPLWLQKGSPLSG